MNFLLSNQSHLTIANFTNHQIQLDPEESSQNKLIVKVNIHFVPIVDIRS